VTDQEYCKVPELNESSSYSKAPSNHEEIENNEPVETLEVLNAELDRIRTNIENLSKAAELDSNLFENED
jgi:Ni,Fe-hydrogenase III large subunit